MISEQAPGGEEREFALYRLYPIVSTRLSAPSTRLITRLRYLRQCAIYDWIHRVQLHTEAVIQHASDF